MKKRIFYFLISKLPKSLRYALYRRLYARVPILAHQEMSFELAKSKEDLESAFKLLHDAYVEQGFIEKNSSGMHLAIQHALPVSSILVAKYQGAVVGTISIMRDNPLGLPMEKAFDITDLKSKGRRVAEFSSLAIHPQYRRKLGKDIFFPLTLFAALFAKRCFGTDFLVFNLYPHHADFYNAIFGSSHLMKNKNHFADYLGAPATGIKLDLNRVELFAAKKYLGKSEDRDLYTYTFVKNHSCFLFPESTLGVINYPVMTPHLLDYFFYEKTRLLLNLSELEKHVLRKYYPGKSYSHFNFRVLDDQGFNRKDVRWDTQLEGKMKIKEDGLEIEIILLDASIRGFRAFIKSQMEKKVEYSFRVNTLRDQCAVVKANLVWRSEDGSHGFCITECSAEWEEFISRQGAGLYKLVS